MRITSKGQVTIPKHIREQAGLLPHTEVELEVRDDGVFLRKIEGSRTLGPRVTGSLRGSATVRMSTEEIMALTRGD